MSLIKAPEAIEMLYEVWETFSCDASALSDEAMLPKLCDSV